MQKEKKKNIQNYGLITKGNICVIGIPEKEEQK